MLNPKPNHRPGLELIGKIILASVVVQNIASLGSGIKVAHAGIHFVEP